MQISVARKNGPPFHNPAISQSYSIPILGAFQIFLQMPRPLVIAQIARGSKSLEIGTLRKILLAVPYMFLFLLLIPLKSKRTIRKVTFT